MNTGNDTGLRLYEGEDWQVPADTRLDRRGEKMLLSTFVDLHATEQTIPAATLRRIGWLDQKGRVWTEVPPPAGFDGGSLTPLLIDARGD
jgi:hypothetical protein